MKKVIIIFFGLLFILFNIKKIIVLGMIAFGALVFPEASQALRHYCFGNGEKLVVHSGYIIKSPVVQKHLRKMKVGDKKKIGMHQWEDWRLSFAINPFSMEKRKDKVIITQWMKFDNTGNVITWFGPIPLPDNIVHTFNCTPYLFYHEFPINALKE